jgi:hypothetical protein
VELGNVAVIDSLIPALPPGGDVLIDSTAGPLFAIAPRDSFEDAVLGFEIMGQNEQSEQTVNTNWPRRHSFPTFWLNVLEYLAGRSEESIADQIRPGSPVQLEVPGDVADVVVVSPQGARTALRRGEQDLFHFHDAHQPGVYQVMHGDAVLQRFAVNAFDQVESDVRMKPSQDPNAQQQAAAIRIGNIDVAASVGMAPSRKELWKLLLIGALVVLLVEWYIYNRRVYI